ncbi:hypothetical protein BED47_16845 [Gottfriedia luciferensis]|uniref:Uncharacterized protein n=1 Tax=Gottfriedia luciferensis TaxID=178774 RepID=A0ABX2ZTP3_9BACI|nr:hypothetical protein [Gottfriedia luciferensis]ODG93170.1 hypothetical protein BED47_16845 [Gottfriedia luciferensis]
MRTKKAIINSLSNVVTYILLAILTFFSRKIFLENLGVNIAGFGSLLQNIMGLLSLAELGIGIAILYALYKPYNNRDFEKVVGLVKLFGKFYKWVSLIMILMGGIVVFLLQYFVDGQIPLGEAQLYFIIFLVNNCVTYWFSYKFCLLNVSQNTYLISLYDFIFKVLVISLQLLAMISYNSYLFYLIIMFIGNLAYLITINFIINKKFPWIKTVEGKISDNDKTNVFKNIKALFVHKLGSFVVFSSDNIMISLFINLATVANFTNYTMITNTCNMIIGKLYEGISPSLGNLLLEKNEDEKYYIFKNLFFLNFWIASLTTIALFNMINQFIIIWLGKSYLLDDLSLIFLIVNFYLTTMRPSVEKFKEVSGLYSQDKYAPIVESIINIIFSIIFVKFIGLSGILLGTLLSNLLVIFWIKPKIVFNNIFNKSVYEYFYLYFKYIVLLSVPLILTRTIVTLIDINKSNSISAFILNGVINLIIINLCYTIYLKYK